MGHRDRPERPPGRETRPAYSRKRRTWYGHGQLARTELDETGRFIHDTLRLSADVFLGSLPVLLFVMLAGGLDVYGPRTALLAAILALTLAGTAVRGGWIPPLATSTLGWVALTPSLVALRVVYYNFTLGVAAYGGVAVATAVETPPVSLAVAVLVGVVAALSFPRVAETTARTLDR
ncbi:hypothetical protein G9464_15305 [Halostella sp. JP-L12]|uniref:hypothetical protein n=1 Tax=Halostella TaxID=1843185 RepID=UPI000EF81A82|nr:MULTISPECIES: hypothetical protein [Halostella]NHN48951.1 hypothetical protein [Halostella sp. JP-L12]